MCIQSPHFSSLYNEPPKKTTTKKQQQQQQQQQKTQQQETKQSNIYTYQGSRDTFNGRKFAHQS